MARGPRYNIRARQATTTPTLNRSGAVTGRPPGPVLPGGLGARTAAIKRAQGAPTPPQVTEPLPEVKCAADYIIEGMTEKVGQFLINKQLHARRPSYIDPPLASTTFQRHVGTGTAASGDPPIIVGPGGAPTLIVDLVVPPLYRGIIKYWGINVVQGTVAAADLRWRFVVNGQKVAPFDPNFGAFAAASVGDWAGPPFTLANPSRDINIQLNGEDIVQLQALNFGIVPLDVQAMFGGWIYQPTVYETGRTVRATMTDQH